MKCPRFITRTRILAAFICILVASIVFVAGGVWGFNKGYAAGIYASSDAYVTMLTLRELRDGEVDQVVKLLETKLDGQIVGVGMYEPMHRSRLNIVRYTGLGEQGDRAQIQLMADVAKYREKHPTRAADEAVREIIRSTLERFAEEAKHNPDVERPRGN